MDNSILHLLAPELVLVIGACILFVIGAFSGQAGRASAPFLAILTLIFATALAAMAPGGPSTFAARGDISHSIYLHNLALYVRVLAGVVGVLLLLLAWPSRADATGNSALNYGKDAGEFFALALLSICGIFLVADANDLILLFLGLELVSIPTYIMVSISRPLSVSNEAGVKYFFLGAMAAALMLFGFSFLYGVTGTIKIDEITAQFASAGSFDRWQMLAIIMLVIGLAFKIAAVPLHFYAGDVYEGAAVPVTSFLAFVPKTAGFVALIKMLLAVGGPGFAFPAPVANLLWVMALLTMTVGNVLGLLQQNIKRVLAYSSVAHSGYMLVGLAAMAGGQTQASRLDGLLGVFFYLAAYGLVNTASFGVLILLPSRRPAVATSAETFEDIAGQGRRHIALGLSMALACFSLIGLPLTVGFFGKIYLIKPALEGNLTWLAILTVINAAISAAYYLRIVAALFLRSETDPGLAEADSPAHSNVPVAASIGISVAMGLLFGIVPPATTMIEAQARDSTQMNINTPFTPPQAPLAPMAPAVPATRSSTAPATATAPAPTSTR